METRLAKAIKYDEIAKAASTRLTIWTLFGLLAEKLPQDPTVKRAFFEFGEALLIHNKNATSN